MKTHSLFTDPVPSGLGYSVRESLDNEVHDKVIEVTLTTGQVGHVEVRKRQSMWRTSNGPFFTGGIDYVTPAGTFLSRTEAVDATVAFLKTAEKSILTGRCCIGVIHAAASEDGSQDVTT